MNTKECSEPSCERVLQVLQNQYDKTKFPYMNVMLLAKEIGKFPREALNELHAQKKIRVHEGKNHKIIELVL